VPSHAQSALVVAVGFAFGFRVPPAGLAIGMALLVPLAVSLAALSYAFALVLRRQEVCAPMASTVIVLAARGAGAARDRRGQAGHHAAGAAERERGWRRLCGTPDPLWTLHARRAALAAYRVGLWWVAFS
jgi:hypothetical protein